MSIEKFHYKLRVQDIEYQLKDPQNLKSVTFTKPLTEKCSKLYIIKRNQKFCYVGFASTPMAGRFYSGFQRAKPGNARGGYSGYRWAKANGLYDIFVYVFQSKDRSSVEAIEAEVVYQIRKNTDNWPTHQTEIHFRKPTQEEKRIAKSIYEYLSTF